MKKIINEYEEKVKQVMLEKILYVGKEIPSGVAEDKRSKFVLLGNPQEFLDDLLQIELEGI